MAGRGNKAKLLKLSASQSLGINKSLSGLRQDDRFCDLGFVCIAKGPKSMKSKTVFAHKAVLMPLSGLITELAEISYKKQLGDTTYISMPEVDFGLAEKLMKYIYEGEVSVTNQEKKELVKIAANLDLDVNFDSVHQNGANLRSPSPVEPEDDVDHLKREARERKCCVRLSGLTQSELDSHRLIGNENESVTKPAISQMAKKSKSILLDDSESDDEDEPLKPICRPSKRVSVTRNTSSPGYECCELCPKVFIGIDACKRHMETAHKAELKDDGDDSSSSDFAPVKKPTTSRTKSASNSKKRSIRDDIDDSDDDDFVKPAKASQKKPKMSKLMSKLTNWAGGDDDASDDDDDGIKSTPTRTKSVSKIKNGKATGARKCARCDKTFNDTKSLRAHIVVHFKDELDGVLPSRSPFNCPICKNKSRDKTTLMRHYLLTHNKIDEIASEEDLEGIACQEEDAVNRKSKYSFLKDNDDSDSDDNEGGSSPKISAASRTSKLDVSFSDSDDDFKVDSSKTVLKTFDELFNDS